MPKSVSYGVVILNELDELLLAHVTGQHQWDIPKGAANAEETPLQAAVRETFEETGIALRPEALEDLGRMTYTPKKDLHLFKVRLRTTECDLAKCECSSFFPHFQTGAPTAEVDDFRWALREDIPSLCTKNMAALLAKLLTQ
jgi:putative (di)nucleoside polyphosphate hydrolase